MLRKWASSLMAAALFVTAAPGFAGQAQAAPTKTVAYAMANGDFSQELTGTWDSSGTVERERTLILEPGGAAWQGIAVTGDDNGPSASDTVFASVVVTVGSDAASNANVLVRLTDGSAALAEVNDMSGAVRGARTELTTTKLAGDGVLGSGKDMLYVELHNDTGGTIEVHGVKVWGIRSDGTTRIDYPLANASFASPLNGATDWGASKAHLANSLLMQPGAALWRSLTVGDGDDQPHAGDRLALEAKLQLHPDMTTASSVVARLNDGTHQLVEIKDLASVTKGKWQTAVGGSVSSEPVVPEGVDRLWLELHNDTNAPIRVTDVRVSGEREDRSFDLNGDGLIDGLDEAWLQAQADGHAVNPALDYDGDGELTGKDVSYFRKFALHDSLEAYANLNHLDFLSEKVTIDDIPMMITHLYAEPLDRADLSKGYTWVGDPQEGVSALDDVARAVLVYVEHYKTYGDAHSYEMIKRGLEFAMWMQSPEGDFDNFVAEDANGHFFKKESHSSFTAFSSWAVRAYEAMATALPVLKPEDAAFAAKVNERLGLCLRRVDSKVSPEYGTFAIQDGKRMPQWMLLDDYWLSSSAIVALAEHVEATADASEKALAKKLIAMLGEGLTYAQGGDFDDYPFSAFMHSDGTWYEWGSIQAKAMAIAGKISGRPDWIQAAEQEADSFLSHMLISGRAFHLSPNPLAFPQINYSTASYVENYLTLYDVTGEAKYAEMAGVAASWWLGANEAGQPMFDQKYGYAFDGITESGISTNSGAESVDEALRAILRLKRVPEAVRFMTGTRTAETKATIVEAENLYLRSAPPETQMDLPEGGLNDPAKAVRKQSQPPQTDERTIYEDALAIDQEQEIYAGWQGKHAVFVDAAGYNNVRIFDGGYLYKDVPVGGANQFRTGDSVKLDFATRQEFDVDLTAEVLAYDAEGHATLLADDSTMKYLSRFWYAGQTSVKTTPIAQIPDGTVKLRVRFSNASANVNPHEGYVAVTLAKWSKMSVPELRYGGSALSNGSYVSMPPSQERSFPFSLPAAGQYDIYVSAVRHGEANAATVKLDLGGGRSFTLPLAGEDGETAIVHLGTAELNDAGNSLTLTNLSEAQSADIDAIYFYPVETKASFRLSDGSEYEAVRDSWSRSLTVVKASDAALRERVRIERADVAGNVVHVQGNVVDANGDALGHAPMTVKLEPAAVVSGTTDANGAFALDLAIPGRLPDGTYRIEAATERGSGTKRVIVDRQPDGGGGTPSTGTAAPPGPAGTKKVLAGSLKPGDDGTASVTLADGIDTLVVGGLSLELGFKHLRILTGDGLVMDIPAADLQAAYRLLGDHPSSEAGITIRIVKLDAAAGESLLGGAKGTNGGVYAIDGGIYRFEMSIGEAGREQSQVHAFAEPLTVTFPLEANEGHELAGVYFLAGKGDPQYVGGQLEGNSLTAKLSHFSVYGVLAYDVAYMDVPKRLAAYNAIHKLTAMHIVSGTPERYFLPYAGLSRAAVAAMIVRALQLPLEQPISSYGDVPAQAWYASYIASATKAGIFRGRSAKVFDPDGIMSDGELRVVLGKTASVLHVAYDPARAVAGGTASTGKVSRAFGAQALAELLASASARK